MKNFVLVLLTFLGLAAIAPKAEAGQYKKIWNGHGYTYVKKSDYYGRDYRPRYRTRTYYRPARSHYYSQPARYYRDYDYGYYRPARTYRSYDDCERPVRYYSSRPRIAFTFGF